MLQFKWIRTVQTKKWQKQLQVTWFSSSDTQNLKKVLTENWIVVMSVTEFWQPLGKLYEVGLISKDGDVVVNIIFPVDWKIRDAFKYFIDTFGIIDNIKYIKPYWKEIEEEKLANILDLLKREYNIIDSTEKKIGVEWSNKPTPGEEGNLQGKLKNELLENVSEFINEMETFLPYTEWEFPVETKKMYELINQLKKYKMSTNLYKLSNFYKQALDLSEKLYNKYFEYQKKLENRATTIKLISELEIILEYKNYEKVKRAKTLEKINSSEFSFPWYQTFYYKIFWKTWIHIKLIIQEFLKKLNQKWVKYDETLLFLQFLIIFLILDYTILLVYFSFQHNISRVLSAFYMITLFWYLGIWITLAKICKNVGVGFLLIVVWIISWSVIKYYFGL